MKPSNFILDLLRTYGRRGVSARNIMTAARLFNFSDNQIRVTLSRLVSRDLIENVSRGHYRLAAGSDPIKEFVEEWRLGEQRVREWSGAFVTVYLEQADERQSWVLGATGFRPLGAHLWARPDNLRRKDVELHQWLWQLGLPETVVIAENSHLNDAAQHALISQYEIAEMQANYTQLNDQLKESALKLQQMSAREAMVESFSLGGKVLQVLAKDPYLPDAIMPIEGRLQLCQTMLNYDELGRKVWSGNPASLPAPSLAYA